MPPEWVAIGSQVSAPIGLAATALPPGSRVLAPEGEFTSVVFPFLVRDVLHVDFVPLEALADAIDPWTDMVAFSAVQSANGRVADLDAIATSAEANETLTLVGKRAKSRGRASTAGSAGWPVMPASSTCPQGGWLG